MQIRQLAEKLRVLIPNTYQNVKSRRDQILASVDTKPHLKDVYVSLTTYAPRMDFFEYAVLSILNGTVLPEKILINVPGGFVKELFDKGNSFLKPYYGKGLLELVEMPVDYYCHSKYYYSFRDYGATKDIVLCDDDVIYYKRWLEHLYGAAQAQPSISVFAYRTQIATKTDGAVITKNQWKYCGKQHMPTDEDLLFVEAVGGVFYRRGSMLTETLNHDVFMKICPKADDVWLWFCTFVNGNRIQFVPPRLHPWEKLFYLIPQTQEVALWHNAYKITDGYIRECQTHFEQKYGMDITTMPKAR